MHGDKELIEKLGRNDPCPCGSGLRFQAVLSGDGLLSMAPNAMIIGEIDPAGAGESQPRIRLRQLNGHLRAWPGRCKLPFVHLRLQINKWELEELHARLSHLQM